MLLQEWIDHHAAIVGEDNLLILDNMSTRPEVLSIYDCNAGVIPIGAFDGFVDNPHCKGLFSDLYAWLTQTTDYYILLDTDERLVWVEGEAYVSDSRLLSKLARQPAFSALPGTWLYNRPGSKAAYQFTDMGGLIDGLRWGKPLLSTAAERPDTVIHNCQAEKMFAGAPTNLFVLHLNRFSTVQRLESNLNKLRSHGIISPAAGVEAVAEIDMSSIKGPTIIRLIDETLSLSKAEDYTNPEVEAKPYSIVFKDGRFLFDNPDQLRTLQQFTTQLHDFCQILNP